MVNELNDIMGWSAREVVTDLRESIASLLGEETIIQEEGVMVPDSVRAERAAAKVASLIAELVEARLIVAAARAMQETHADLVVETMTGGDVDIEAAEDAHRAAIAALFAALDAAAALDQTGAPE